MNKTHGASWGVVKSEILQAPGWQAHRTTIVLKMCEMLSQVAGAAGGGVGATERQGTHGAENPHVGGAQGGGTGTAHDALSQLPHHEVCHVSSTTSAFVTSSACATSAAFSRVSPNRSSIYRIQAVPVDFGYVTGDRYKETRLYMVRMGRGYALMCWNLSRCMEMSLSIQTLHMAAALDAGVAPA